MGRPKWVDEAARLYEAGYSLSQVAIRVSKHPSTVRKQLKRVGVVLRSVKEGARLRHETFGWVDDAERLYQEGYSLYQVATRVGKSYTTVRDQLQQAGTELRSKKEGTRLRKWQDNGTLGLSFEPSELTLTLIGYGVGDGHLDKYGRYVSYAMKPTIVREHTVILLQNLSLRPFYTQRSNGVHNVVVSDVRWTEFNQSFFTDYNYLRIHALKYPEAFVYGFLAAEGSHCIESGGSIKISFSNTDAQLLELITECLHILEYETTLGPPNKNGVRELRLRGSSLGKARFAVNSPWPNKRIPSNYLVRRSAVNSELRNIYDRALEELYVKYGKELVDHELLPAKYTGKSKKGPGKKKVLLKTTKGGIYDEWFGYSEETLRQQD